MITRIDHDDLFIGGAFVRASATERFTAVNPATEEIVGTVPVANAADVDRAVSAARTAFGGWSRTSPAERSEILWAHPGRKPCAGRRTRGTGPGASNVLALRPAGRPWRGLLPDREVGNGTLSYWNPLVPPAWGSGPGTRKAWSPVAALLGFPIRNGSPPAGRWPSSGSEPATTPRTCPGSRAESARQRKYSPGCATRRSPTAPGGSSEGTLTLTHPKAPLIGRWIEAKCVGRRAKVLVIIITKSGESGGL